MDFLFLSARGGKTSGLLLRLSYSNYKRRQLIFDDFLSILGFVSKYNFYLIFDAPGFDFLKHINLRLSTISGKQDIPADIQRRMSASCHHISTPKPPAVRQVQH